MLGYDFDDVFMKNTAAKFVVTLVPIALLVMHLTVKTLDAVALGLAALAILPWLATILETAELPGGIKVEFKKVKEEQERQGRELEWIKFLIKLVVSDYERAHLQEFAKDGPYFTEASRGEVLEWELRHLTTLDLVVREPGKGIRSLFAEEGQRNVKEHFKITPRGRDYLRMFEEAKL